MGSPQSKAQAREQATALLWQSLVSPRFCAGIFLALIVLCALGAVIPQDATSSVPLEKIFTPELLYPMRQLGLTDIFHSGWFILALNLLALNLAGSLIERLPEAWRLAFRPLPAIQLPQALQPKSGSKKGLKRGDGLLGFELETALGKEEFRDLVMAFCRKRRIGRTSLVREEKGGGELQVTAQEGRFSRLCMELSRLFGLILLVAMAAGLFFGFEGQVILNEGAPPVERIEVLRGTSHPWLEPGFGIEAARIDLGVDARAGALAGVKTRLNFHEGEKLVATSEISVNHPARFRGLRFFQGPVGEAGQTRYRLQVQDRQAEATLALSGVPAAEAYDLDQAAFKILESSEDPEFGPSIQLEYRESDAPAQTFWIFERFPKYDEVRRKQSRYHFVFEGTRRALSSQVRVVRDPGVPVLAGAGVLLLLSLFWGILLRGNAYWFSWKDGKVTVVGASRRLVFFEPRFRRLMEEFREELVADSTPFEIRNTTLDLERPKLVKLERMAYRTGLWIFWLVSLALLSLGTQGYFASGRYWAWGSLQISMLVLWLWLGAEFQLREGERQALAPRRTAVFSVGTVFFLVFVFLGTLW